MVKRSVPQHAQFMMVIEMKADTVDKVLNIIESLYPDFKEYADNEQFHYWMEYACELDELMFLAGEVDKDYIDYLNKRIFMLSSNKPEHQACTDVASTLEEAIPSKFKGVFVYE